MIRRTIAIILNFPAAIPGIIGALLSVPRKVVIASKPFAVIFYVRSFWWWQWLPGQSKTRGMANSWCIQLGPTADDADLAHELVHVEQAERHPFIFPFLYMMESKKSGYRNNKFEEEAYSRSGSRFEGEHS